MLLPHWGYGILDFHLLSPTSTLFHIFCSFPPHPLLSRLISPPQPREGRGYVAISISPHHFKGVLEGACPGALRGESGVKVARRARNAQGNRCGLAAKRCQTAPTADAPAKCLDTISFLLSLLHLVVPILG